MAVSEERIANLPGTSQQAGDKKPQHVLVVDGSGNAVTFGGSGGTSEVDSSTFTPGVTLGTPAIGAYQATPDTLADGELGILALDTNRNLKVNVAAGGTSGTQYTEGDTDATATGNVLLYETDTSTSTLGVVSSAAPLPVRATGFATGGHTTFRSLDLDETEEEVKASAGTIYGIIFTNTSSSTRWLKLYNATAAGTTVGATTPQLTIGLPGTAGGSDITGSIPIPEGGIAFTTAISAAATTGIADADTGAPGANEVSINILYR